MEWKLIRVAICVTVLLFMVNVVVFLSLVLPPIRVGSNNNPHTTTIINTSDPDSVHYIMFDYDTIEMSGDIRMLKDVHVNHIKYGIMDDYGNAIVPRNAKAYNDSIDNKRGELIDLIRSHLNDNYVICREDIPEIADEIITLIKN